MTAIRPMTLDDEGFFLELIALTGWGNTAADFRRMLHYEPGGCFLAAMEGARVGMVNSTLYGEAGWIGNLVVHPHHRGRGTGEALMRHAMAHLADSGASSIRLDAVQKAIPLYERLGFKARHWSLRFSGLGRALDAPDVIKMTGRHLGDVVELDKAYFGLSRERVLRRVLEDFPGYCFAAVEDGVLKGFIMAKAGESNIRIGPWICEPARSDLAEALLRRLMTVSTGEKLWIGIPEGNQKSVEIVRSHGFEDLQSSLRMCYGECPTLGDVRGRFSIGGPDKG